MAKKVKEDRSGDVLRTNRMYISLKAIGEINEKGKSIFSIGYSGKNIAEPDRPLSTAVFSLVAHVANMAKYTSQEEAEADLKEFKKLVKSIKWVKPQEIPNDNAVSQE